MTSAEKFEILSAYLDDEASQEERYLVEQWIKCDPLFRHQYQVQLALKSAMRSLPADLFDQAIAEETLIASDRASSNHSTTEQTTTEQTTAEQCPQSEDFDNSKTDRFSIHTTFPSDEDSPPSSIGSLSARSIYWSDASYKPTTASCTAASKWKNLLIVAAALAVTAFTMLSYGSIKSAQSSKIRRTPGRIAEIDASFWAKRQLVVFPPW
ncbi:MAG: hypothetical protein WA947_11615 [Phormidesmis sp.]